MVFLIDFLLMNSDEPKYKKVIFHDLGLADYREAWDFQELLFQQLLQQKTAGRKQKADLQPENYLIFCEHPHVYTLGKSGNQDNLLISGEKLKKINAAFYKTNRGGDITYHGPGQIVGYPVLDLEYFNCSIKQYVSNIEEIIINTLSHFGIIASRMDGAAGVWIDARHADKARKICAIGVRASRHITMHGFALNVNTDIDYFNHINPCGFTDKSVTTMEKETGRKTGTAEVKAVLHSQFSRIFNIELTPNTYEHGKTMENKAERRC